MAVESDASAAQVTPRPDVGPLCSGVKHRAFDDGVVVYVAETCETHLLPPEFAQLFNALASSVAGGQTDSEVSEPAKSTATIPHDVLIDSIDELVRLKILEPTN